MAIIFLLARIVHPDCPREMIQDAYDYADDIVKETSTKSRRQLADVPYHEIVEMWHIILPRKPKVAALTEARKEKVRKRYIELSSQGNPLAIINETMSRASQSKFLMDGGFFTFDWLFKSATNFQKVREGNYDNSRGSRPNGYADKVVDSMFQNDDQSPF